MDEIDLEDNSYINLVAYYGEREDSLVGVFRGKFKLNIDMFNNLTYMIIICLILLLVILFVLWKKKQDDEW